jgi:sec-independent protein translocase protein TatB
MAAEFQGQFQEAMREAEMADLKKTFDEVKEAATGLTTNNVMTSLQKDVGEALRIDDVDKPAIETAAPDAQIASAIDAPVATSTSDAPVIPTTPEPPIPETFTEADAHAAAMEPLAITREVQPQPAQQDTAPAASDVLKDAKAS